MPDYQKSVVQTYLSKSGLPSTSQYGVNVSGRAYPDIAAQATNFCVPPFGCGIAGTSCATPTASGIIAALNDARLAAGKSSLGFLNPCWTLTQSLAWLVALKLNSGAMRALRPTIQKTNPS